MQKETDLVFAQHVPHARRQQIHLLRVVVQKFRHRASSRRSIEDVSNRVFTQTLKACPDEGLEFSHRLFRHAASRAISISLQPLRPEVQSVIPSEARNLSDSSDSLCSRLNRAYQS